LAPTRAFAAPILGSVGDVTADLMRRHPGRYWVGDEVGLFGLQARYDQNLRGRDGAVVNVVAADGTRTQLFRAPAQPGEPLRLTLDVRLQELAEQLLSTVGPASALVAVRPSNGDILAAANGPGNRGYNYATYGQLAPGSTFKTISALANVRRGLTSQDLLSCPPVVSVDGKPFTNYTDYPSSELGRITLQTAFAYSCNTAFVATARRLSGGDVARAAADLGVGVDHDLGFPAFFGEVPPPATDTERAADLIGQGRVLMSPLAMAVVAASVQAGHTVVPRLLRVPSPGRPGPSGETSSDPSAPAAYSSGHAGPGLTKGEASSLRSLMRAVVTRGTGAALENLPGPPVLAKTGTAEFDSHGRALTHAWMIAAQGDLAVAVFVNVGESGSHTAGPILEQFLAGVTRDTDMRATVSSGDGQRLRGWRRFKRHR
jgi:cell division protein FtsI/penicillin-binding protein 2